MVKLGEIPEDLCVCVYVHLPFSFAHGCLRGLKSVIYIQFLLQQVKSMQASESNI